MKINEQLKKGHQDLAAAKTDEKRNEVIAEIRKAIFQYMRNRVSPT